MLVRTFTLTTEGEFLETTLQHQFPCFQPNNLKVLPIPSFPPHLDCVRKDSHKVSSSLILHCSMDRKQTCIQYLDMLFWRKAGILPTGLCWHAERTAWVLFWNSITLVYSNREKYIRDPIFSINLMVCKAEPDMVIKHKIPTWHTMFTYNASALF